MRRPAAHAAGDRPVRPSAGRACAVCTVVCAALAGFAATALAIRSATVQALDRWLLLALRDPADLANPRGPPWFEEAAIDVSALGGYPVVAALSLVVLAGLVLARRRLAAAFLLFTLAGGSTVSELSKLAFARPRPDLVDHLDRTFTASFPSGHATFGTVAWLALAAIAAGLIARRAGRRLVFAAAVILALVIGASRVYLGVHWPSDVVAGWSLGAAWTGLCWLAFRRLGRTAGRAPGLGHCRS